MKDGALKDLELCESASRLDLEECQRRLGELEKKVRLVQEGLGGCETTFEEAMGSFVLKAQERLGKLREQLEEARLDLRHRDYRSS